MTMEQKNRPDYMRLLIKVSKDFVTVVKRTLKHEGLKPETVYHCDHPGHYDVVCQSEDRLIIIRGVKGAKKAHMREFDRQEWLDYLRTEKSPNTLVFYPL